MVNEVPLLKSFKITKKFNRVQALNDVSMTINKGEIYGFIGENGSGKTTLIRLITGLMKEDSGEISIYDGEDNFKIGGIIETPAFYPYLSAKENLIYYAFQANIDNKEEHIRNLLNFVGLDTDSALTYKNFSMGMKQRLGLALALLNEPQFLILDEPTNGLDPHGIMEYRELINRVNELKKTTVLVSSHILSELALIATRYGIIHKGSLIKELNKEELKFECKNTLFIDSSDNKKALTILSNSQIDAYEEGDFLIVKKKIDMDYVAKLLFKNSIYLKYFFSEQETLEDYYLRVTKEIEEKYNNEYYSS